LRAFAEPSVSRQLHFGCHPAPVAEGRLFQ
jgi:hypothetical protein